jgi:pyruvate/2-oxoglutarate dehydrogenase complex dihydrolipoamide acyltransferase (E2) component
MTTPVLMPKLGFSMDAGVLSEWLVGDGSLVEKGQSLYSLESDKSVQEIESPAAGVVKILAPAGGTYSVGHVLAEIV